MDTSAAASTAVFVEEKPRSIGRCIWQGFVDACDVVTPIKCLYLVKEIRQQTKFCFILNGIVFLGSLVLFRVMIRPVLLLVLSFTWTLGADGGQETTTLGATGSLEDVRIMDALLNFVYYLTWVYPVFTLSKILNGIYYQEIADEAFSHLRGDPSNAAAQKQQGDMKMADIIFSFVLQTLLVIQIGIISVVPKVGLPLGFVYSCWLSSLYCFEYTWINTGWSFNRRLDAFERHWAYFLGFGLPFTTVTYFLNFLYGSALYALLFPIFIIIAVASKPVPSGPEPLFGLAISRIPICSPARQVANRLTRMVGKRKRAQ